MKICVFSDSHGHAESMLMSIEKEQPDMIIHLGDGQKEQEKIKSQFPQIPLHAVRGNCDYWSSLPETKLISVNGINILLTHGHIYGVKSGLSSALNATHFSEASVIFYGHTHKAINSSIAGINVLNPGSCGICANASFARVSISENGEYIADIVYI